MALLRIAGRVARLGGWTIQLPTRALTWSDETCAIHDLPPGYEPTLDEGIGYFPPEHRANVMQHVETCERDGTPYDFEVPKMTATGRRIWVRSIGEAVRDADGRIVCLQGAFQDITSPRRPKRRCARARPSSAPWRNRCRRWCGCPARTGGTRLQSTLGGLLRVEPRRELRPRLEHTVHPDDRQRAAEAWQHAIAGGDYNAECRLRRADGTYRWMLVRGLPLRDRAGETVKWIGTCTDIDELKQAQEAAQDSEGVQRALAAELDGERARLLAAQTVASVGSWETDLTTLTAIGRPRRIASSKSLPSIFFPHMRASSNWFTPTTARASMTLCPITRSGSPGAMSIGS